MHSLRTRYIVSRRFPVLLVSVPCDANANTSHGCNRVSVVPVAPAATIPTVVLGTWPVLSARYVGRLLRLVIYMSERNLLVLDKATWHSCMKEPTNSKKSFRRSPVRVRVLMMRRIGIKSRRPPRITVVRAQFTRTRE